MLNILVAYPYLKPDFHKYLHGTRFLLDSGAFTAWKAGREILLDDYCRFIDDLPTKPWRYFTLDVIGNPDKTMDNYQKMLSRGYNPIPIFTRGEDPAVIDEYYKTTDLIGVGGLVGTKGNKGFVKGIMEKIGKRKVHWLGFTRFDFIKYYKPYSVDSSSWAGGIRYGVIDVYMGQGRWERIKKVDCRLPIKPEVYKQISVYGFDPDRLAKAGEWRNSKDCILRELPVNSFVRYSLDVEKRLGTKMFLAVCTLQDMISFKRQYGRIYESTNFKRGNGQHCPIIPRETQDGSQL